jgi:hypothetical protein
MTYRISHQTQCRTAGRIASVGAAAAVVMMLGATGASTAWAKHGHHAGAVHTHHLGGSTPVQSTGTEFKFDGDAKGADHGKAVEGKVSPFGPLDTSVTVSGPPKFGFGRQVQTRRAPWAQGWKKTKVAKPMIEFHHFPGIGKKNTITHNAIGIAVEKKTKDAPANASTSAPTASGGSGAGPGIPNAQDGAVHIQIPPAAGLPTLKTGTGAGGITPAAGAAPVSHTAINGRDLVRPANGPHAIGGPTKTVVGAINGTTFHPRHP